LFKNIQDYSEKLSNSSETFQSVPELLDVLENISKCSKIVRSFGNIPKCFGAFRCFENISKVFWKYSDLFSKLLCFHNVPKLLI